MSASGWNAFSASTISGSGVSTDSRGESGRAACNAAKMWADICEPGGAPIPTTRVPGPAPSRSIPRRQDATATVQSSSP
jgi:hypothetical protein